MGDLARPEERLGAECVSGVNAEKCGLRWVPCIRIRHLSDRAGIHQGDRAVRRVQFALLGPGRRSRSIEQPMSSTFRVEWRDDDRARTVWLFGEVDLASVEALSEALAADKPRIELDLGNVTFMDLSGLRCLLDAAENHEVVISRSSPRVDRLLDLTETGDRFERYER